MITAKAIVLIFAHKPHLEWHEEIALRQCFRILGRHPIRLVCPDGTDTKTYKNIIPQLEIDFIPPHWLSSLRNYNRLKILPFLYRRYSHYEFMLTYELDAFVFRDDLELWCDQGWDYIGAPWFEGHASAAPLASPIPGGNSGFSLRKISTMLRVLGSWRTIRPAREVISEWLKISDMSPRAFWWLLRNLTLKNCFHYGLNQFTDNEDMFWSFAGSKIEGFCLAPYSVAAQFSFDCNAERLYLEQNKKLPFGCHKWFGLQASFWKPFIQAEGYQWGTN